VMMLCVSTSMNAERIGQTCIIGRRRYQVDLTVPDRTVEIVELPDRLESPEDFARMMQPVARGLVWDDAIQWQVNTLGDAADRAAAWAVVHLNQCDLMLLFIDETGDESLADPNFPLFGLGGCAIRAADYRPLLTAPWCGMKYHQFGGLRAPMHASELKPSREQLGALSTFFSDGKFFRIAAVVTKSTQIEGFNSVYEAAASMLLRNLAAVLSRTRCTGVSTVFEHSTRGDRLARAFFPQTRARLGAKPLPLTWGAIPKAAGEPGLEVADFVMHAAGTQVRGNEKGDQRVRKDFACVFKDVDQKLVEFSQVRKCGIEHNPAGTIDAILIDPSSERVVPGEPKRGSET